MSLPNAACWNFAEIRAESAVLSEACGQYWGSHLRHTCYSVIFRRGWVIANPKFVKPFERSWGKEILSQVIHMESPLDETACGHAFALSISERERKVDLLHEPVHCPPTTPLSIDMHEFSILGIMPETKLVIQDSTVASPQHSFFD
jgi:hypothetical protein